LKLLAAKKALVTGGTRGIGRAIAAKLLDQGCEVVYTGRSDKTPLLGATFQKVDFLDTASCETFLSQLRLMDFDILVNNAGINRIAPFAEIPLKDFDDILHVNLRIPFQITQALISGMAGRGWGRIVNVSSVFGHVSKAHRASYSASKFALDGMTAAIAAEYAKQGVLINCICPGFITTELTQDVLGKEGMKAIAETVPMLRLGKPEEIANAVSFLCSPENTYMSGQTMVVDGGFVRV